MKIAIDSCSAILLAKASVLEVFLEFHDTIMPQEVYIEVLKGKEKLFKDALLIERLKKEGKLKLVKVDKIIKEKIIKDFNMGIGESSVIALSVKSDYIVLTDNRQGRKAASINNLPLIGSIEVIVNLYNNKKIDYDKSIHALKVLNEEGWFDNYLIEKAMEDIKNGRS